MNDDELIEAMAEELTQRFEMETCTDEHLQRAMRAVLAVVRAHEGDATRCPGCDHQRLEAGELRRELAAARAKLECGHQASLMLHSAETGEPLYCELCDTRKRRDDAERMEKHYKARADKAEAEAARLRAEIEAECNATIFEDGLSGDLREAGVRTLPQAYMVGRTDVLNELRAALAQEGGR